MRPYPGMSSASVYRRERSVLRKLLGTLLILLGLASAGLGVASATVWRDPDTVVATAVPQGDGTLVVTDPGVLDLVSADVTVRATAPGETPVVLAIGRDVDVDGWIGIDHSTRVTGLDPDWETLTTKAVVPEIPEPAEGQEAPVPGTGANPWGNDMWVAEATGHGSATLRWDDRPGRWSLLVASVGEDVTAPTLELTWPREVTTEWLWRGVAAGGVLLLAGLAVLLIRRRRRPDDDAAPGVDPQGPEGDEADAPTTADGAEDAGVDAEATEKPAIGSSWRPTLRFAGTPATGDGEPAASAEATTTATDAAATPEAAAAPQEDPKPSRAPLLSRRARRAAAASQETPEQEPAATETAGESAVAEPATGVPAVVWPAVTPQPAAPGPDAVATSSATPEPVTDEPRTATGSVPLITRRELRAQEEARKAAENPGLKGRLRALTGSIPVVRAATGATPVVPPPADGQPQSRRSHSAAWRQTWGFDPDAAGSKTDDQTEGGDR